MPRNRQVEWVFDGRPGAGRTIQSLARQKVETQVDTFGLLPKVKSLLGCMLLGSVYITTDEIVARLQGQSLDIVRIDKVNKGRPRNRGKVHTQEYPLGRGKLSKSIQGSFPFCVKR